MIFGVTLTSLTFVSLVICIVSYLVSHKNKNNDFTSIARWAFYFSSILIFIQAIMLMWGIQTHQFQWQYVFSYTSLDLSTFYLITTFWGGQEGTFLLWMVLGSVYGIIIMRKRGSDEKIVMAFMALILAFIAMILIKKNPFTYIWEVRPHQFQMGEIPVDGNGLNPLLQDPWMIIHPPVLFVGYSSTMILFSYAMSALISKNFSTWIKSIFPFSLFTSLSLGTGIILGGYWAYTTLGWGGYWGWDPVENSSFIPWLTSLALIHGVIIQNKHGSLRRTNIFLALLTFILVLYGSFLTRTGVLADFSVHSFSQSEINDYLIGFLLFFTCVGAIFFLLRRPDEDSKRISGHFFTRENFMYFGILTLLLSSVLTFLGTSAPLLSSIFLDQAGNVSIDYYNMLNTPVAILLGFFIAISPVLRWKNQTRHIFKKIRFHLILSILVTSVGYLIGLKSVIHFLIFFLFVFAVLINSEIIFNLIRNKNWAVGGYLSHVGIGLMMMGIITSSAYETTIKTTLPLNKSTKVLDYDMRYIGFRTGQDGKDEAVIEIQSPLGEKLEANPKFFWSEFNRAFMRKPSVHNLWVKDIYISPIQVIPADEQEQGNSIEVSRGERVYFEDYLIHFAGYEMEEHSDTNGEIKIVALLKFQIDDKTYTLKPAILLQNNEQSNQPANIPGTSRDISIKNINVDEQVIVLFISDDNMLEAGMGVELLAVEITEKPLINLLWLGTILMIAGLIISFVHRTRISRI